MNPHPFRNLAGAACVLALALLGASAQADTHAKTVSKSSNPPAAPQATERHQAVDSQPATRAAADSPRFKRLGSAQTEAHDEPIKELKTASKSWNLPAVPQAIEHYQAIDSQPETRAAASSRLIKRLGFTANQVSRADRQHIDFRPGSVEIGKTAKLALERLAESAEPLDRIVITGYAGKEIPPAEAEALARRRADAVTAILRAANGGASLQTDATYHWGGSNEQARRAEVFLIRALNR